MFSQGDFRKMKILFVINLITLVISISALIVALRAKKKATKAHNFARMNHREYKVV